MTVRVSKNRPVQELMDLIGCGSGKCTDVIIRIGEPRFDERPYARFVQRPETARQMAEGHESVAAHRGDPAGGQLDADVHGRCKLLAGQGDRDRHERKLVDIVPVDRRADVGESEGGKILEPDHTLLF